MKEKAIEKINKIGKIGKMLSKITIIITIVGIAGCLIGGVVTAFLPKNLFSMEIHSGADINVDLSTFNVKLSDNDIKDINDKVQKSDVDVNGGSFELSVTESNENGFTLSGNGETINLNMRTIAALCFVAAVQCAAALVVMIFVKKLCQSLNECKSPFEENVIKSMKNFAFSLIPWAVVNFIAAAICEGILKTNVNIKANNTPVAATVLIIICLTYIFQYGAMLQKESDETL